MRTISFLVSVVALIGGLYYAGSSLSVQMMTGEHGATLACACFLFVIALGVWRDPEDKLDKRTNMILEELVRRTPKPREDPQPVNYQRPNGQ